MVRWGGCGRPATVEASAARLFMSSFATLQLVINDAPVNLAELFKNKVPPSLADAADAADACVQGAASPHASSGVQGMVTTIVLRTLTRAGWSSNADVLLGARGASH